MSQAITWGKSRFATRRRIATSLFAASLWPAVAAAQQQPTEPGWPQPLNTNPLLSYAALSQNELRTGNGNNTYRWEGEGWYGGNIHRAWLKSEGSVDTNTGELDEAELQALYSRPISRYFNAQAGGRYDLAPGTSRGWGTFGVEGLAPLFWEIGLFGFISNNGHYGARFEGSYDLYLTQRLILQPQFELNFYTKSDRRSGIGTGLSDLDSGLRLRYDINRKFSPYVGLTYEKKYGQAATFARNDGGSVEDVRLAVGLRAWF